MQILPTSSYIFTVSNQRWIFDIKLLNFYPQGLEKIVQKHDIPLLMDEVQTGGGSTGKMWAHEWFELEHGPGN